MNEKYGLLEIDYKMYHPNLLCNDEYIDYYQKNHRNFIIRIPKIVLKKQMIKKQRKIKVGFISYDDEKNQ